MKTHPQIVRLVCIVATLMSCCSGGALAAISGPYSVDANTLQLWHLDDGAAATSAANAVASGLTMQGLLNGATLGNASFPGFGTSLDVSAGSDAMVSSDNPRVIMPPHRAILSGAPVLSTTNGGEDPTNDAIDDSTLTYADPITGAFTFEAIVKFNGNYDPLQPFRNEAPTDPPSNPGSYSMEILTGEGDVGVDGRPFQFRYVQVGIMAAGNNASPKLEFHNITNLTGNQLFGEIPTTGPNAVNNTDWFHAAVTYNGNDFEADNLKFYWTKLDASVTTANQLTVVDNAGVAPVTWMNDLAQIPHDFSIGNESRNNGTGFGEGENFYGQIDEVRISGVARAANEFIFAAAAANNADFDGNGRVDGHDFLRWQRGLGSTGAAATLANGNANGDNVVDAADLAIWKSSFGSGGISAVPEPTTLALTTLVAACGFAMRRLRPRNCR